MNHIEQEKETVRQMIYIYCQGNKHSVKDEICEHCITLLQYAYARLDHCKFGTQKPTCKKCPIHCYKPAMREEMKKVMRYAGPRMILYHPITALKHIL